MKKKKIVRAFSTGDGSVPEIRASVDNISDLTKVQLRDFASKKSLRFFNATGISPSFLKKDPVDWAVDADFLHGLNIVSNFKIVNDAAERGVQLITRYMKGNKLTIDEEERQRLLLVVSEDRKSNKLR